MVLRVRNQSVTFYTFVLFSLMFLVGVSNFSTLADTKTQRRSTDADMLPSREKLDSLITTLPQDSADNPSGLHELYQRISTKLDERDGYLKLLSELESQVAAAPARLELVSAEFQRESQELVVPVTLDTPLPQIQDALDKTEAELEELTKREAELITEHKRLTERRLILPDIISQRKSLLEEVNQQLSTISSQLDNDTARANRWLLLAEQAALDAELALHDYQIQHHDLLLRLASKQREGVIAKKAATQRLVEAISALAVAKLRAEADQAVQSAQKALEESIHLHPSLVALATENESLAEQRSGPNGVVSKLESTVNQYEVTTRILQRIHDEFISVQKRLEVAGINTSLGYYLIRKRAELPNVRLYRKNIALRQAELAAVQLQLMEFDDKRAALHCISCVAEEHLKEITELGDLTREQLSELLNKTLADRRDYLDALRQDTNSYFLKLIDLDTLERELVTEATAYASYINEHILWIRSTNPISFLDFQRAYQAAAWLLNPQQLTALLKPFLTQIRLALGVTLAFLLLVVMAKSRTKARRILAALSTASVEQAASYLPPLYALGLTLWLAIFWPAVILAASILLAIPIEAPDLARALAKGLLNSAPLLFALRFIRVVCRPNGLGEARFRFPAAFNLNLRRHLELAELTVIPAVILTKTFSAQANETYHNSLGRMIFIILLLSIGVILHSIVRPSGVTLPALFSRVSPKFDRLKYVIYGLLVGPPLVLAGLAVGGYYYTASVLVEKFAASAGLLLGLATLYALALELWRVKQLRAPQPTTEPVPATQTPLLPPSAQQQPGATEQSATILPGPTRTITYFRVALGVLFIGGSFAIWSEILPALDFFQRIPLWTRTVQVSETVSLPDGASKVQVAERLLPVTLFDFVAALLIFMLTYLGAYRLPRFFQTKILHRLPLNAGSQYAITTLIQYILVIIGLAIGLHWLGLSWSSVSMVAAAVSVGLGFGLQEIFANFVSGLILLFEQPIRVGDVVTIGDVSGKITKIKIRATTILAWDRKELIVPNREFITGKLINWTLTDTVLRLEFAIGVAYGSDTLLVYNTLMNIAQSYPGVLPNPPPHVLFDNFGDNTLNFLLRLYVDNINITIQLRHGINMRIDQEFRKAGIEIAFPQRDIHIRSVELGSEPLNLRIQQEDKRNADGLPGTDNLPGLTDDKSSIEP